MAVFEQPFFLKRISIAFIIYLPAFRAARQLASIGAIVHRPILSSSFLSCNRYANPVSNTIGYSSG
jgi:hypothetical protein